MLGIGPAAGYQARHLMETREVDFPLLLDPHHRLADAISLGRQPLHRFLFSLRGWWNYLKALPRGRQGAITGAYWEVPGIVVTDEHARVIWVHRGRRLGDYPPIATTVARLRQAIGS